VIPAEDMVRKIRVATEARESSDFLVIARTDARTSLGLDEALRRAEAYARAGADIIFVESPESEEEMARICRAIDKPLIANMVEGGRTPVLPRARLEALGYRIAIFPASGFLAAGKAMQAVYRTILEEGSTAGHEDALYPFDAFSRLMGFERVWDFDRRHAE
jgi:2-methylisocitrate lyase-like PEP mutase family enzyme